MICSWSCYAFHLIGVRNPAISKVSTFLVLLLPPNGVDQIHMVIEEKAHDADQCDPSPFDVIRDDCWPYYSNDMFD
jgi:hypothetical protein